MVLFDKARRCSHPGIWYCSPAPQQHCWWWSKGVSEDNKNLPCFSPHWRKRLLLLHLVASWFNSFLYFVSSSLLMRTTAVVSSVGLEGDEQGAEHICLPPQAYVLSSLLTVLSEMVLDVLFLTISACGLSVRKSSNQLQKEGLRQSKF